MDQPKCRPKSDNRECRIALGKCIDDPTEQNLLVDLDTRDSYASQHEHQRQRLFRAEQHDRTRIDFDRREF